MTARVALDFDVAALYSALDAERTARGIPWQQLAREVNAQFAGTLARPISPSTISRTRLGGVLEGDTGLQLLRWLGRTPESFVPGHAGSSGAEGRLPELGRDQILRFDARVLYAALDAQRQERGLTWAEVASEIGDFSAASLRLLEKGGRVAFPSVMRIVRWLGRPAASFTRASAR